MTDMSPGQIAFAYLIIPLVTAVVWFLRTAMKKRLGDVWNLTFRRSRVIRADIHTLSGRVITKYVVPDQFGVFKYNKAVYIYKEDHSEIDPRYSIPKMDYIETQIHPESGNILYTERDMLVKAPDPVSGQIVEQTVKVPQYLVSHSKIRPKLLKLSRRNDDGEVVELEEPPVSGVEVANVLDSHIVDEVTNASIADTKLGQILIAVLIIGGVLLICNIALYAKMNSVEGQLNTLTNLMSAAAHLSTATAGR